MTNTLIRLQALAHPARLEMCRALIGDGPMNVTALCRVSGLSQSATSQHLKVLRGAGFLTYEREAQHYMYRWLAVYPNGFYASIVGLL